jgi:nitroreductase
MDFKEIVKNRYSVRQYRDEAVPEETIEELLEIIGCSVSAINLQPWKIKVVADQETKEKLLPVTFGQTQVTSCSHLLVLCADVDYPVLIAKLDSALADADAPDEMREGLIGFATDIANDMSPEQQRRWSQEQVYIALGNAVNGAYALGLGACPMTAFQPAEYSRVLGLPETVIPTVLVSVGYPTEEQSGPRFRYPLREILV